MVRTIAEVAVNVPLLKLFHYRVPDELAGNLELGHRVSIPFGRRWTTGICVGFPTDSAVPRLKPIREILHPQCRFDTHLLQLTRWLADYYHAPWGEVLEAALPPPIRSGTEVLTSWILAGRPSSEMMAEGEKLAKRAPSRSRLLVFLAKNPGPHRRPALLKHAASTSGALRRLIENGWAVDERAREKVDHGTEGLEALSSRAAGALHPDQEAALQAVRAANASGRFRPILLHGVTGSGKTEVYLQAFREVLACGKRGLLLVPEISLTPQTVLRFRQGLPREPVAVLHSMLTSSERAREWREIHEGKARLVIGARSSIFAPIPDLGLVVVDEEHDASYKQDSSPRYHARDVAVVRAQMLRIPIILGSATPSLESCHNASSGKYQLLQMPRRVTAHELPIVTIVPLQADFYRLDGSGLITEQLDTLIRQRLAAREQILLFLNRRGFATYLHCVRCGFILKCAECDITLTFHRTQNAARCHYCGHRRELPPTCPECDMPGIRRSGVGTEKVVAELGRRYEEARVARLDRDTVSSHGALRSTIASFARGDFNILVGTQMVAKGHDFPEVTLVGIINADTGLHFADFRAAERTFQLITQVAGRAGRGSRPGRVVIQSFFPDHFAVRLAATGEFPEFCRRELEFRKALGYPPFGRLVKILFQGPTAEDVAKEAQKTARFLRESEEHGGGDPASASCRVLGPAPSPISKIQGKHRWQILLKSPSPSGLHQLLDLLEENVPKPKGAVERAIDVDPQSML